MIAIRFDGPPSHESGRFIEVERDGASISFGEWKQDGEFWLLELPEVALLEDVVKVARTIVKSEDSYKSKESANAYDATIEAICEELQDALAKLEETK